MRSQTRASSPGSHATTTAALSSAISFAARGRAAAAAGLGRQSGDAGRGIDHHGAGAPDAGGESCGGACAVGGVGGAGRGGPQDSACEPAHAGIEGATTDGESAALGFKEAAREDGRGLGGLIPIYRRIFEDGWETGAARNFDVLRPGWRAFRLRYAAIAVRSRHGHAAVHCEVLTDDVARPRTA